MTLTRALRWAMSPATLIVAAALLRLALALSMGDRFFFADTAEYEATAVRFLQGLGAGESTPRAPLYPAFLAVAFSLGGVENRLIARLLQLVLGVLVVVLTGRLARSVAGPSAERPALFAAAFSPLLVFSSGMLYPTTLYTLILMGATMSALAIAARPTLPRGALLGACLALGWLTDPVIAAPGMALLAGLALRLRRGGRPLAAAMAVALIVAVGTIAPYMAANRPADGGRGAFMQKAQYVLDWSRSDPRMAGERRVRLPADTEFRPLAPRAFVARGWGLLRAQPFDYLYDVGREFTHFFSPMPDRVQTQNRYNRPEAMWAAAIHFTPILLLALLGLAIGAGAVATRWTLASVIVATAGFYALFFTQARYRIPVEPLLIVLAAAGLVRLLPRVAAHLAGPEPPPTSPTPASSPTPAPRSH